MNKFPDGFKEWVLANPKLVDMKPTSNPDLFVLKYKRKVFYDALWNDILEDCRGTIVDSDWNIVSLPFRKIYNYGIEKEAPVLDPDTLVRVYKKYNGFMVAASSHKGELIISTTGSIDSDFVKLARKHFDRDPWLKEKTLKHCQEQNITMLFECCDASDPHIISEVENMYSLGYRYNDPSIGMAHMFGFRGFLGFEREIEKVWTTMEQLQASVKDCRHEGYVFYTDDGVTAKIKSPHYLVKKLFMRGRDMKTLLERNAKEKIDEEYYPLLDYLSDNHEKFDALDEQGRRLFIEEFLNV